MLLARYRQQHPRGGHYDRAGPLTVTRRRALAGSAKPAVSDEPRAEPANKLTIAERPVR